MEDLVGRTLSEVEEYADANRLELHIEETPDTDGSDAVGTVLDQSPAPGIDMVRGSPLWVEILVEAVPPPGRQQRSPGCGTASLIGRVRAAAPSPCRC